MKNILKKGLSLGILCFSMISLNPIFADAIGDTVVNIEHKSVKNDKFYNEVRKVDFGNNMQNVIKIKYHPEVIRSENEDGSKMYMRYVTVSETLYLSNDGGSPKKLLQHSINAYFTYDKKTFVGIKMPEDEIECNKHKFDGASKKWKMAQTYEILRADQECIVSEMFTLFKQDKLSERINYIEDSHVDIICNTQGDIAINSKSGNI